MQIPEEKWVSIRRQLLKACSQSNRSSKPAIYGAAATEEVKKLKPLKRSIEVSLFIEGKDLMRIAIANQNPKTGHVR